MNPEEVISEALIKINIICGLKLEYIPLVTSIQVWAQQSSLEEFENLLSSQGKGWGIHQKREENSLVSNKSKFKGKTIRDRPQSRFQKGSIPLGNEGESTNNYKTLKCYWCGKSDT